MSEVAASRVPPGIEAGKAVLAMFERYGRNYLWFAVVTAMIGSFSTVLTGTIINVAIPEVMGAFGIGQDEAQWLSTGFLAAGTVTMLLSAWAIEALGMRIAYAAAMIIFLAGSILGGIAPSPHVLVLARVIQGAASGIVGPMSMVINYQIFPVNRRGMAMGIFGIGTVLAPALGPTVGGYLIDHYSWRYVFFMVVPFSLVSVPLALMFMPEREEPGPWPRFDWTGVALLSVFLVTFLTALTNGQKEDWDSDYIVGLLGVAFYSFVLFLWWETRAAKPMLNLKLFLNGRFLAAAIVTLVLGIGLYGSTYLLPLFLQTLQHITPTDSGLLMLPAGLCMAVFFPIAGTLSDHIQPRLTIIGGLILFGISSWLMRLVDVNTPYTLLVFWALIGRIGLALIFPSLNAASLSSLPLNLLSQGSGAINFLRQLGGALGVNFLSIFLARQTAVYSDSFAATQDSRGATLEMLHRLQDTIFGMHIDFLMKMDLTMGYLYQAIYAQATSMAFRQGFYVVSVIFFLTIIPTWFMKVDRSR